MNKKTNNNSIMKKFFFIAAAVVAMAACTKTEVQFDATSPSNRIAFEVASYAQQTKANSSLATEFNQFHTYAYQFPTLGDPVIFMDENIYAWKDADHSDATNRLGADETSPIVEWAPQNDYFWPKTGTINFYSYAGTKSPDEATAAAAAATATTLKTVKFTYTDKTITSDDNILVADPAIGKSKANANANAYNVDKNSSNADVTKGVPTLFHHMLTKIQFDVKLKTSTLNSNIWKVTVLNQFDASHKSQLIAKNQGTLALTSVEGTNAGAWSPSIATATDASSTAVLWVPTTSGTTEEISLSSEEMTLAANAETSGDAIQLLALRSVMPQLSSGVKLSLVYKVQAFHDTNKYLEEIRVVGLDTDGDKNLSDLVNSAAAINWLPNKKITYHIVIDPVTEKVTFDPAVENYSEVVYNEAYDIDINEGGIVTP